VEENMKNCRALRASLLLALLTSYGCGIEQGLHEAGEVGRGIGNFGSSPGGGDDPAPSAPPAPLGSEATWSFVSSSSSYEEQQAFAGLTLSEGTALGGFALRAWDWAPGESAWAESASRNTHALQWLDRSRSPWGKPTLFWHEADVATHWADGGWFNITRDDAMDTPELAAPGDRLIGVAGRLRAHAPAGGQAEALSGTVVEFVYERQSRALVSTPSGFCEVRKPGRAAAAIEQALTAAQAAGTLGGPIRVTYKDCEWAGEADGDGDGDGARDWLVHDVNGNGRWDPEEGDRFVDLNGDGTNHFDFVVDRWNEWEITLWFESAAAHPFTAVPMP
jgi:hypothetical protein